MNGHLIVSILPLHSRRQAQEEGSSDGRKEGKEERARDAMSTALYVSVPVCKVWYDRVRMNDTYRY